MPNMIYKACLLTKTPSNTRYIQEAVCEKLARDLDIPVETFLEMLPALRGPATTLIQSHTHGIGPANTFEHVK